MEQHDAGGKKSSWMQKASPAACFAFFGALLLGLVAQGMGIFNKFSWHDDISSLFLLGDTITSGRWMLHVLGEAEVLIFGDGHFSLPVMNGFFALLCVGASAGLLVWFLQIRSRALAALLGGAMAAFPMVTALFSFMFAAPYYMLALLMMTACGVLACGEGPWWKKAGGCVLGGCSVGIYQAFLPVLLTMMLLGDIRALLRGEFSGKAFGARLLSQALCAAGVMAVYVAGSRFFLWKYDLQMASYMGLNEAASLPLSVYLERGIRAWREYFLPTRNVLSDMYPQHAYYVYLFTLGLNLAFSGVLVRRAFQRGPGRGALLACLLALYPLGCGFIYVMSGEVHSLMTWGQVMHFALLVFLTDELCFSGAPMAFRRGAAGVTAAALAVTSLMYVRYDNQCYLKAAFQQQEAISWYTDLITRVKSAPGFRDDLPVAWVNPGSVRDRTLYHMGELDLLQLSGYSETTESYVSNWAWEKFMRRWCGFGPYTVPGADVEDQAEVRAMPCYPAEGSIRLVEDVLVVKLGDAS